MQVSSWRAKQLQQPFGAMRNSSRDWQPISIECARSLTPSPRAGLPRTAEAASVSSPFFSLFHPAMPGPLLLRPVLQFASKRDPEEEVYELSLGKIIDTLRDDYCSIFQRGPNAEIYDERVVLEIGDPVCMKPLRGKLAYTRGLEVLRNIVTRIVADGKVECHIHDKTAPPEWALKVFWVCSGQIGNLDFKISANSLYGLVRQPIATAADGPVMAYKIDRHRIEFTEILPWELKRHLSTALPAAELNFALATQSLCCPDETAWF